MLGQLPRVLDVNGTARTIRAGYVNILTIISAYQDTGLSDQEKIYICLLRMFPARVMNLENGVCREVAASA